MPVYLRDNQYKGVNAHLHSNLQNDTDAWSVFHGTHITLLALEIDVLLPPGYIAEPERGLQIKSCHPFLDEEAYLTAVAIRRVEENNLGRPVTWLELLSPTNKPAGAGYHQYLEGRENTLRSGIALIELDYLHQSAPVIGAIPSYPDREQGAYPYHIAVTNPRPNLQVGRLRVYGFEVDAPMPVISIPLAENDEFTLDFGKVYHQTYASLSAFSRRVDYEREPEQMASYTADDQARIHRVMQAVAAS